MGPKRAGCALAGQAAPQREALCLAGLLRLARAMGSRTLVPRTYMATGASHAHSIISLLK